MNLMTLPGEGEWLDKAWTVEIPVPGFSNADLNSSKELYTSKAPVAISDVLKRMGLFHENNPLESASGLKKTG